MSRQNNRILVTGGATFIGDAIISALLAEGAEVTVLVRPGAEERLGVLSEHVEWYVSDVWDSASLRGRGRGHQTVIHTVGSLIADPTQGLSLQRLNLMSARNVVTMCVSDGVPHMMLISAVHASWMNRNYIRAKRDAEEYLERVGVNGTVIRAPLVYKRKSKRPFFFELMTGLGSIPPLSWTRLGRIAPMPVDLFARGVARIALDKNRKKKIYYARDLRRLNKKEEHKLYTPQVIPPASLEDTQPKRPQGFDMLDEDTPFGWQPPKK